MTTATLPRRFMRPVATAPARRSMLIGFFTTLAAGLGFIAAAAAAIKVTTGPEVLGGVSVGGVEIAGLDRAAAAERLATELPSLSAGRAVIEIGDAEETVAFADLGRGYETDEMLDAALAVGRTGNPVADGLEMLRSLVIETSLPVVVRAYDAEALDAVAGEIADRVSRPPVEATVARDRSDFQVSASQEGSELAAADVAAALATALDTTDPADVHLQLSATAVQPQIDTATAEAAAAAAEAMATAMVLEVPDAAGEKPLNLRASTIAKMISFGPEGESEYAARLDAVALTAAIEALKPKVDRVPVNATITVAAGSGLGGVVAGKEGRELDVEKSATTVLAALRERAGGASVASVGLAVNVTEPALTTAEAEAMRPKMQLVSSWTTHYVPNDGNGFGNNINIPARDIDGRNLAPGEWFSFWDSIGPVTVERGFHYGGVIIGGRSVAGGAIGGGICSTSTTIFNAALRAGLEMGDRLNHYYYIDRYPDGLDATVYMDDSYVQDMTFRNDTDAPIVIRGFGGDGFVTFELWSVPSGRTVVITDPVTSNHRSAIETTVVDPSMAPGTSRRVEYPHDGHDVTRTRFVYDANGTLIHQNTYFSAYKTVNGITAVGPAGSRRGG